MANHALSDNFAYFFKRLNPSPSFEQKASSEHKTITGLIENSQGLANQLSPRCFLQGSYKQETAIYTINDVDIVVLCNLCYPGSGQGKNWNRDEIFETIAAPLRNDGRYKDKVRYHSNSMCIKVELGIKIEILPVVYKAGNRDFQTEPFCLYRPENSRWEDGYARYHQQYLTNKNKATSGNFIPAIKIFKHLRSKWGIEAVSFHVECLLFSLPDNLFGGNPTDYIPALLKYLTSYTADAWWNTSIKTPCGERNLFCSSEWGKDSWLVFHRNVVKWSQLAQKASLASNKDEAINAWQELLGSDYFPKNVNR